MVILFACLLDLLVLLIWVWFSLSLENSMPKRAQFKLGSCVSCWIDVLKVAALLSKSHVKKNHVGYFK